MVKLKDECTYYTKCEMCGSTTEWILRSVSSGVKVNPNLTYKDVVSIVSMQSEDVYTKRFCEECGMDTLQKYVAWDYIEEE